MLRWILGGREAQGAVECVCDGRFASAGDDGLVLIWNVETGDCLLELRGHTQQITAMTSYTFIRGGNTHTALITASSDRTLSLWDPDSGNRVQNISDLQSSVKCLLVLDCLDVWLSGGNELCVWNQDFELQCKTVHRSDTGISAMVELPKNFIAAAMDKEIVIFKLNVSGSDVAVMAIRHLADHQDTIHSLISINDDLFASGSHIGELIIWDSVDWTIQGYELILWEESKGEGQSEVKVTQQKQIERSIQHMSSDGKLLVAAVGSGLYVYNVLTKTVVAYRKMAHDSNVLHTMIQTDGLMSCSEDGSVRMWELQDLPLPAEPASSGFFGMFGTFGRASKHAGPPAKKLPEVPDLRSLELIGDLIGHSGAVQMFVSFEQKALVTCSTDHLLIVWKDGELQSQLRSLAVFHKLEENQQL